MMASTTQSGLSGWNSPLSVAVDIILGTLAVVPFAVISTITIYLSFKDFLSEIAHYKVDKLGSMVGLLVMGLIGLSTCLSVVIVSIQRQDASRPVVHLVSLGLGAVLVIILALFVSLAKHYPAMAVCFAAFAIAIKHIIMLVSLRKGLVE